MNLRATKLVFALVVAVAATNPLVRGGVPQTPDRKESAPADLAGTKVEIEEHLNAQLPLDATFTDHDGHTVHLRDYFDGQHPVILTLNYFKCPMLCGLILNGMVDGLRDVEWSAGDRFRIVTLSFDPMEPYQLAHVKRKNYLEYYTRPEAGDPRGWAFLVGHKPEIDRVLNATGFKAVWNEQRQEWSHQAALIICSPDGRISRYLYGVQFEPKTLRLSLVEASEGKIGATLDHVLLFCYHYDGQGKYALRAMNLMRAAGFLTLVVVATLLIIYWRREARRARSAAAPPMPTA